MKKSSSVAGTAAAMPLSRKTASRRRNSGTRQARASGAGASVLAVGRGARLSSARPTASVMASNSAVTPKPAVDGSTLAATTPTSAKPSRQATTRLCIAALPPSRAAAGRTGR